MIGQKAAVKSLQQAVDSKRIPHSILLSGPTGTGKTTIARIVKKLVRCDDADYVEENAATNNGVDYVRALEKRVGLNPIAGKSRLWLIDEAHQLTKQAQNAFLKLLEDTPDHVYFILATTHPEKLIPAVRNRLFPVQLKAIGSADMKNLIAMICKKEEFELTDKVIGALVESSEGSARSCLQMLSACRGLEEEEQLEVCEAGDVLPDLKSLALALLDGKSSWTKVVGFIKSLNEQGMDAEGIRRGVLRFAATAMAASNKKRNARGYFIFNCFEEPYYNTDKAGLWASAYTAFHNVDG